MIAAGVMMEYEESLARALAFLPVIRDVFKDAAPTVEGRERVMQQLNRRLHERSGYQRLPQRAQMFLAGYIHRCFEERFGVTDAPLEQRD